MLHPDLNTPETTKSGPLEGMALAIATGFPWQAMASGLANVRAVSIDEACLLGARDIDNGEADLIRRYNVPVLTNPRELKDHATTTYDTYVHLDMDVRDALAVRINLFAVPDGLGIGELCAVLCTTSDVRVASLTRLDPCAADGIVALQVATDRISSFANAQEPLM